MSPDSSLFHTPGHPISSSPCLKSWIISFHLQDKIWISQSDSSKCYPGLSSSQKVFLFILFCKPHEITTLNILPCAELFVPFNTSFILNLFFPSRLLSLYPTPSPPYLFGKLTNILSNLSHTTWVYGFTNTGIFFSAGLSHCILYISRFQQLPITILYLSPPLTQDLINIRISYSVVYIRP